MNREEYIVELRERNGQCGCPDMDWLATVARRISELSRRLREPWEEIDGELGDLPEVFRRTAMTYHHGLDDYAKTGKIKFVLHDVRRENPVAELPVEEVMDCLGRSPKPVFSAHCARCNQQIDVAS